MIWAIAAAGCSTRPCREGTLFLDISYSRPGEATGVDIVVTLGSETRSFTLRHAAGASRESVELAFSNGYPVDRWLRLEVRAFNGDVLVGSGRSEIYLSPGCAAASLLVGPVGTDAGVEAAEAGEAEPDLVAVDLAAPDLDAMDAARDWATFDESVFLDLLVDRATPIDYFTPVDYSTLIDLVSGEMAARPNYMFVTSQAYVAGALGNLANADAICAARAAAGGLAGTYVAWLSTSTVDAANRVGAARGWIRPDGKPLADTMSGLNWQQIMFYPPVIDELGQDVTLANPFVTTGSTVRGTKSTYNCADWTSTQGSAAAGNATGGPWYWTNNGQDAALGCGSTGRLYCFGTDYVTPVVPPVRSGRLAFLSKQPVDGLAGVTGADGVCAGEALAAGLSGTFLALIATTSASAASRFVVDGGTPTWSRPDGVILGDLLGGGRLAATVNVRADSTYFAGNAPGGDVWLGASDLNAVSVNQETCNNWSSNLSGSNGLAPYYYRTITAPFPGLTLNASCASLKYLYCLQR